MDIKEQILNELAQFCREAENDTDLGERADTMDKYADNIVKLFDIPVVSNSKADEREQAYQKYFRDDPQFRGRSYRLRDNYIWHKDEAYECIDYYLRTGIEP